MPQRSSLAGRGTPCLIKFWHPGWYTIMYKQSSSRINARCNIYKSLLTNEIASLSKPACYLARRVFFVLVDAEFAGVLFMALESDAFAFNSSWLSNSESLSSNSSPSSSNDSSESASGAASHFMGWRLYIGHGGTQSYKVNRKVQEYTYHHCKNVSSYPCVERLKHGLVNPANHQSHEKSTDNNAMANVCSQLLAIKILSISRTCLEKNWRSTKLLNDNASASRDTYHLKFGRHDCSRGRFLNSRLNL